MSEERSKIMDNLIAQDADLIEPIAQIDVDAAIEWYSPRESEWQGLLAEAFARHRLAERAAIVAWLRGPEPYPDGHDIADDIEAGEHLK